MPTQWFYTERGEQRGPVDDAALQSRVAEGSLTPDDLVWTEGMATWVAAGQVKGLFPNPSTSAPPLPNQAKPALQSSTSSTASPQAAFGISDFVADQESKQWAMFLHLCLLLPGIGWIASILIWQLNKTEFPWINAHGNNVCNWLISSMIYLFACIPLVFVLVGIPLAMVIGLCGIIFPIIGGIKASNGEVWPYPLAISFFK